MAGGLSGLSRENRLRKPYEFRRVRAEGRRTASSAFLLVKADRIEGKNPRLGLVVSRRVGNAVVRNALKRGIREWFRLEGQELLGAADLVVVARVRAAGLKGRRLRAQLNGQLGDLS